MTTDDQAAIEWAFADGRHEAAEDRRIARTARQERTKATLVRRAEVTERLCDLLAAARAGSDVEAHSEAGYDGTERVCSCGRLGMAHLTPAPVAVTREALVKACDPWVTFLADDGCMSAGTRSAEEIADAVLAALAAPTTDEECGHPGGGDVDASGRCAWHRGEVTPDA